MREREREREREEEEEEEEEKEGQKGTNVEEGARERARERDEEEEEEEEERKEGREGGRKEGRKPVKSGRTWQMPSAWPITGMVAFFWMLETSSLLPRGMIRSMSLSSVSRLATCDPRESKNEMNKERGKRGWIGVGACVHA